MNPRTFQRLYEAFFWLHSCFAGLSAWIRVGEHTPWYFLVIESRMNDLFGIPNTDMVVGNMAIWPPTTLLALLIWLLLWRFGKSRVMQSVLLKRTGYVVILTCTVFHVFFRVDSIWTDWFYGIVVLGVGSGVGCLLVLRTLEGRIGPLTGIVSFGVLYVFWWVALPKDPWWPGYDGPAGPVLGFCAMASWSLYVASMRSVKEEQI